jgi:hypothetical protein
MRGEVKLALALWAIFAVAVFSVTFDWRTRQAAWHFMAEQSQRRAQGLPLDTIDNGFRPMMHAAARQSAVWLLLILAGGTSAVLVASRRSSF